MKENCFSLSFIAAHPAGLGGERQPGSVTTTCVILGNNVQGNGSYASASANIEVITGNNRIENNQIGVGDGPLNTIGIEGLDIRIAFAITVSSEDWLTQY